MSNITVLQCYGGAREDRTPWEELKFLEKEQEEYREVEIDYERFYPTRVNRMRELKILIEKSILDAKVKEWNKETRNLPEWRRLKELEKEESNASRNFVNAEDEYSQSMSEEDLIRAGAEVDKYKEEVFLPAVDRLPFGKEYRAAHARLEEIEDSTILFVLSYDD